MKVLQGLLVATLLVLFSCSATLGYHVPPWDTGHNSFQGDEGDDDTDPGDDGPCKSGSPVELANGNFVFSTRDLLIAGLGPALDIVRTYNSRDMRKGPFGNGWVFPFDQRLTETTDGMQVYAICSQPNGKRERFTRMGDGSYRPAAHVYSVLTKNSDNSYSLRDKDGIIRRFNPDGKLARITDHNGNSLTLSYDATGFPTTIADATGRIIQLTKGSSGRIESITDPANRVSRYAYDNAGNLIRFTDLLGNSTTYQYDTKNNLSAIIDPRGNKLMSVTYGAKGRVATLTEGAETWTYSYLTNPRRTTKRDSANNTWTYFYNDSGNLTRLTDPLSSSETYVYDANLNLTELTDKNGNKTTFTYDSRGNPLTITDALGSTRTFTYESNSNRPRTVRDRVGNPTNYEYDDRGNLIRLTNPLGHATQFQYHSKGQLAKVVDAAGNTASFDYDTHGNLIKTTSALGDSSAATFDVLGKAVATTDALGRSSQYIYDANEQLIKTTNPQGGSTSNEYDTAGNLTAVVLPTGARTTFEYDALNRLVKVINPLNQSTTYSYDRKNNLTAKTDPRGQQIRYSYDALSRLTIKSNSDNSTTYSYDRVGNLLTVSQSYNNLTFVPDALNRITEVRTGSTSAQPATSIRYAYDANGNRLKMTDPAGGVTNYVYDALSRLTSLTDPSTRGYAFTYDNLSRRTQLSRSAGAPTTTYAYDAANRLTTLLHQSGAGNQGFNFTFDRVGNRLSATDSAGVHSYSYDSLYQLTSATHPGGGTNPAESYTYDPAGNRTASHLSATYTHNAANRLTADAAFDYTYDLNGNLTRKTERATGRATTYTYGSENQLTQIRFPDNTSASYRYDGLGRRIEKNVNGQITSYVYDGQDILFEYSAGAAVTARYTHGPGVDEVLSVQRGGSTSFFETDALGSVVRVTDGGGVKASYVYDSFGRIVNQTGTLQAPYLFHGREYDQESGLYYFRARYYDPTVGRFLSEDPISFAGGSNFYQFALNNAVNVIDPFGLRPCTDDWLDRLQLVLDFAGLVPGFGEPFDLANAGIYGLRGDSLNASLSAAAAVPFLGWGATGAKLGNKATKGSIWAATQKYSSVQRALYKWNKHKSDFPEFYNSKQYVDGARNFFNNPPLGTKTITDKDGNQLFFHEPSNNFGITNASGVPKTFFRPSAGIDYWNKVVKKILGEQ